ncbi:MAG TPA: Fe-S cluster assembly protein SufD [Steroidobacteraceae bacterium]|jgi:FeS assembly protein SufD, group 1|nr:Fe-S cluster assembly protein SufD [Steroidobacteraceae bacterium]HJY41937.1 Fe-S cluster assembly protein SufD [Steroidobacteraceae bacterium]
MSVMTLQESRPAGERYRAEFDARWSASDALVELRRAALERFVSAGFPAQRQEDWKYTNLRRLEARTFAPATSTAVALDALEQHWIANAGIRIVLVNGHWMPALSSVGAQLPGMTLLTLKQWSEHEPAAVAAFIAQTSRAQPSALEDLNLAFFEDGVVLDLAAGASPDQPIYIVHQWSDAAAQLMSSPRVVVRAAANSRCTVIEHFIGSTAGECFTNAVSEIEVGTGAKVEHYRIQQESTRAFHIGHVNVRVQQNGRYASHDIALGASLARLNLGTVLQGPGAHVDLRGLLAPLANQHLDSHTTIDHAAAHTSSDENYRGIAGERGRGVFNGKVIVRPDAQKTDARQSSRNLLLAPGAEIDTKPELEIYANDVKCSHGATTGQLDGTALFYLRSRGLDETAARALLIRAFAESVVSSVGPPAVRSHLEQLLDERYGKSS